MAGNHLSIAPGLGEAAIWNPQPAVQAFTNMVQQKRQQQLANQQALLEQAGRINPNGIREADRSDYINKYNDWKQAAIDAANLPQNSRQRMDAMFDAQNRFGALNQFIGESKQEGAREHQLATSWASNPHLFDDNAHGKFLKSMQSPMSTADYVPSNQYLNFDRYIDPEKINGNLDKANKALLGQSKWSDPIQSQGVDKQGNKTGVVVYNERTVDPEKLIETHLHIATLSDDVRKFLDKTYPGMDLHQQVLQNLVDRGDLTADAKGKLVSNIAEKTKPTFKSDYAPDRFYEHQLWKLDHPSDGGTSAVPKPIQNLPYANGANFNAKNFVAVSLPNKNFAGTPAVDLANGKPVKALEASDDYSVVGAGDVPLSKRTGQVAQPNWEAAHPNDVEHKRMVLVQKKDPASGEVYHYLVDYDKLPKNVANEKNVRVALDKFNKTPVYGGQQQASGMVTVRVNGKTGHIPAANYEKFKKEYPNAERIGE